MTDLSADIKRLRPQLAARSLVKLAPGEALRAWLQPEIARFYDLLADAVEHGSSEPLQQAVKGWVDQRPSSTGSERDTFIPLLHTLRTCTWELLAENLPPQDAMRAVLTLESLFAATSLHLSQIEYYARLGEIQGVLGAAQAEMERLDKSKSDFIAVAAHELKTPLTLIQGYATLLRSEFPPERYPRVEVLLRGLGNGTIRLNEIIQDMIDVSLIDNRLLTLTFEPVDLPQLIRRTCQDLGEPLQQRHLTLSVSDTEALPPVTYADPQRLRQVLMNVLLNAIKFTPDGGAITIGSRGLSDFAEITVADTGIGIAPENLERVFEKFGSLGDVALHSTGKTKFKGGGTGLGLSIARGIVEAHGGNIWVESPGYDEQACPGSTFHIVLPVRATPPDVRVPQLYEWARDPRPWRNLRR